MKSTDPHSWSRKTPVAVVWWGMECARCSADKRLGQPVLRISRLSCTAAQQGALEGEGGGGVRCGKGWGKSSQLQLLRPINHSVTENHPMQLPECPSYCNTA